MKGMSAAIMIALAAVGASARHRLEPKDGVVFHIAGQSETAFTSYSAYMQGVPPAGYMWYVGLGGLNSTAPGVIPEAFVDLKQTLDARAPARWLVPQIGLSFTANGKGFGEAVAAGEFDAAIRALARGLASLDRPVLMRVGYEFNGRSWNGYNATAYAAAFRRITTLVRETETVLDTTLATVWDYSCDDAGNPWEPFWPGSAVVDWWGVNIFSGASAPDGSCASSFIDAAAAKGYPVILGESTPRHMGAGAPWDHWFGPYLDDLMARPAVKAFSYIDWNWTQTERWPTWGDARVEDFPQTGTRWRAELANASRGVFSGAGKAETLAVLGL